MSDRLWREPQSILTAEKLYPRVAHVVPSVEWATMADDVDAIQRFKGTAMRSSWRTTT
ncbi:MAG: hypothetical protein R2719_00090 [Micropruina sp.]